MTNDYLKQARITAIARVAIMLAMSISWLVLVNHCELAAAIALQQAPAHDCCKKDKDADPHPIRNGQHSGVECCKGVLPIIVSMVEKPVSPDVSCAAHPHFPRAVVFPDAAQPMLRRAELDTGPPFAGTFAEAVLQRSILAHAPPHLI
jgi:hypothetical protein